LGYNRRAVNLRRAVRIVVDELGGVFPRDVDGLLRLPGIGPYTARAVASIAYRLPVGAVDTNVRRVLGRVLTGDPAGLSRRELQVQADWLVDPAQPDDWTHALMDIGSVLCRPARPLCSDCPVAAFCRYAGGERPAAPPARSVRRRPSRPGSTGAFRATTRWLRGRILDRLRAAPGDAWTSFAEPIGEHDPAAILASLQALAKDGLLELESGHDRAEPAAGAPVARARLPIA
jgi:A/G-specific adenine glycosylase